MIDQKLILKVIAVLGGDAHGVAVRQGLSVAVGKDINITQLYIELDALESNGFIYSFDREGGQERNGRPRRYFKLTRTGQAALNW